MLFAELGSDAFGGGVTLAVLTSVPVASGATVADTRNVMVAAPAGMLTVVLMLPLPDATAHVAPRAPVTHVAPTLPQEACRSPSAEALLGPALLTVIVYVVTVPGTTVEAPFVFVIEIHHRRGDRRHRCGGVVSGAGSGVTLETVAGFTIGSGVV